MLGLELEREEEKVVVVVGLALAPALGGFVVVGAGLSFSVVGPGLLEVVVEVVVEMEGKFPKR